MKKRVIASILVMAMALSMVACGTKEEAPAEDVAVKEESPEEAPAEEAEEAVEGTLSVLVNLTTGDDLGLYEDAAVIVEEKYPGVTVEFQNGGSDYYTVLATRINADEVPDVFITMGFKECDTYSDYIYDWRDDAELMDFLAGYNQDQLDCVYDSNGKVCGVPTGNQAYGYIYNKTAFADAGIEELPTTLDELRVACEKLVAAGYTPFCNGYKEWWIYKHSFSAFTGESFGCDMEKMSAELTDGTTTFSDLDKMGDMFDLLDLTLEYGHSKQMEMDASTACTAFANGEGVIMNNGTWVWGEVTAANPDIEMGFMPEPIGNDASLSKLDCNVCGTVSIGADTDMLEAAKAFVMAYSELIYATEEGINSSLMPHKDAAIDLVTSTLALDVIQAENARLWSQNWWPAGFEQDFGTLLQEYSIGTMTRDEVLVEMQNAWNNLSE